MTTTISVGIMGFSHRDEYKFKKIFGISEQYERSYKLNKISDVEAVGLLIVKKGCNSALHQQQIYQARYKNNYIPVVTAGSEVAANEDAHYIRGVLVPSRVFAVLDSVEIAPETKVAMVEREEITVVKAALPQLPITTEPVQTITGALQVLVVDDSAMMQKTIAAELKKAPIPLAVDFADTGEIALEKIKLKKYDFIFLDVMMAGIDGFQTCAEIRKFESMAKTPIIMLTAKASALDEVKGLMAGCTTYLTKPFVHDEFHKILERIMHWIKEFNDGK